MAGRWREIVVIKASGYSSRRLFSFFLIIGLILSLSSLIFGESIVPFCTRKAMDIRRNQILKQPRMITHGERAMWVKGLDGSLIRIDGFIEDMNMILRISIFEFDDTFNLRKRIEADRAFWSNDQWILMNVRIFDFRNGSIMNYETYPSRSIDKPDIFREEIKKPKEMNFLELYNYYSRLERAGFKNPKYVLRLYEKLAYPAINFIMILFGLALSLNTGLGGGIRAAGIGVLISVLYWLIYSTGVSLGTTGILPPLLAAWIAPFVFVVSGSALYLRVRD
jgi:lipopolysaccharide export system permease protein